MTDRSRERVVHAEDPYVEVVRYDRSGKWKLESKITSAKMLVRIDHAVRTALRCWQHPEGTIYFDRYGGSTFNRKVRAEVAAVTTPSDKVDG